MGIMEKRGVVALTTHALVQAADLIQTEFKLARAELGEKLVAARNGFALMMGGAVFLVAALFLVLQSIVALLIANGMEPPWAVLIVAGGSALIGAILVQQAKQRLSPLDAVPEKTIRQLHRDGELAKEKLS